LLLLPTDPASTVLSLRAHYIQIRDAACAGGARRGDHVVSSGSIPFLLRR
jgi:hypothetical protein